jgi:hypothetical protein
MAFIVQTDGNVADATSVIVTSEAEALSIAIQWLTEGRYGVKIIGDGRIYTTDEFAMKTRQRHAASGGL